jgi:predicted small secreted protein
MGNQVKKEKFWKGTFGIPGCFLIIKEGVMNKMIGVWGILLMCFLVAGTGCHTMEGAGKDVEKAGEKVQDAAD